MNMTPMEQAAQLMITQGRYCTPTRCRNAPRTMASPQVSVVTATSDMTYNSNRRLHSPERTLNSLPRKAEILMPGCDPPPRPKHNSGPYPTAHAPCCDGCAWPEPRDSQRDHKSQQTSHGGSRIRSGRHGSDS